jgi:hypothetical protein
MPLAACVVILFVVGVPASVDLPAIERTIQVKIIECSE